MIGLGAILSNAMTSSRRARFCSLPGFRATSCLTVVLLVCLETVLLSTVSNCAKTFYMHWNTTNSIFRIDNTDHIIDVNKGNLAFEYDQVHIICPVYEPGTFENETEKYIIYNVSKVEYETCRITNANPRIIAICDKPQKLMFFTITFRPFTPQPGGLEFLPGNDYYFISTSSKDDLHRRIGGRCSTNNMKVVFKVCCSPDERKNITSGTNNNIIPSIATSGGGYGNSGTSVNDNNSDGHNQPPNGGSNRGIPQIPNINTNISNVVQSTMSWPNWNHPQSTPITSTLSVQSFYPYMTSPRPTINSAVNINNNYNSNSNLNNNNSNNNNSPSHKPTKKTNEYDKHPNEVVKNEELTYSNNNKAIYNSKSVSKIISMNLLLGLIIYWCQR